MSNLRVVPLLVLILWRCAVATAAEPLIYDYQVLEKLPHDRANFIQGLQIVGDRLYVGTGQYGESALREYDFPAMTLRRETRLPETLFGEGVTRLGDRIYQLTWRARRLLIHDAESLKLLRVASIPTEGWGLTHNGQQLLYSDGTDQIYFLNAATLEREKALTVLYRDRPLSRLNELEWVDGQLWANVWGSDFLVRIDPDSGIVNAVADLRGLLLPTERQPDTDVLNGIAWDGEPDELWVTGKRWPWIYRLSLKARPAATEDSSESSDSP